MGKQYDNIKNRPVYDPVGNLNSKKHDAVSTLISFSYDALNRITGSSMGFGGNAPSCVVSGSTTTPATSVAVNGNNAMLGDDNTFCLDASYVTLQNGANTFTAIAQNASGLASTNTSTVNVIAHNSLYSYDLNGNLLADGIRCFAYDDENELISVWQTNVWRNDFVYDGKMRRRIERDYTWNAGTSGWQQTNEVHFLYDGNLVIQERNLNNNPQVSYTRGNDLSGTRQGAGGIGGLLARSDYGQEIPGSPTTAYYHADGNGNVTYLMYTNQIMAANTCMTHMEHVGDMRAFGKFEHLSLFEQGME